MTATDHLRVPNRDSAFRLRQLLTQKTDRSGSDVGMSADTGTCPSPRRAHKRTLLSSALTKKSLIFV